MTEPGAGGGSATKAVRKTPEQELIRIAALRSYTLMRWTVNKGSHAVRINYSDQEGYH